jgi:hypothetical protein
MSVRVRRKEGASSPHHSFLQKVKNKKQKKKELGKRVKQKRKKMAVKKIVMGK